MKLRLLRVFTLRGMMLLLMALGFWIGVTAIASRMAPGSLWGLDIRTVHVLGNASGTWPQVIIDRTIGNGLQTAVRLPDGTHVTDTAEHRALDGASVVRGVWASRRVGLRPLDQETDRECWQGTGLRFYEQNAPFPADPIFLNRMQGSPPNPFCNLENGTYATDWEWTREPIWWAPWIKFQVRTTSAPFRIDGVAGVHVVEGSAPLIVTNMPAVEP